MSEDMEAVLKDLKQRFRIGPHVSAYVETDLMGKRVINISAQIKGIRDIKKYVNEKWPQLKFASRKLGRFNTLFISEESKMDTIDSIDKYLTEATAGQDVAAATMNNAKADLEIAIKKLDKRIALIKKAKTSSDEFGWTLKTFENWKKQMKGWISTSYTL